MKGKQFKAQKYASAYLDDDHESARTAAYIAGFDEALDMAAGLVESFQNPKTQGLGVLIRVIGKAEVDQNGVRVSDEVFA